MVTVQAYRLPMSVGWNVLYLACLLARVDRVPTAVAVWNKMRLSLRTCLERARRPYRGCGY